MKMVAGAPPRAEIPSSCAVMGPECPRCAELSVEEIVNGFWICCVCMLHGLQCLATTYSSIA